VLPGFLLGTRQTLLETFNGGKTWTQRTIEATQDEGFNYRFSSISFSGDEGWIVGKPAILLHTSDGGQNWERIPLSSKLPGIQEAPAVANTLGCAHVWTHPHDQTGLLGPDAPGLIATLACVQALHSSLLRFPELLARRR
jgi:hypothetical protein